MMRGLCRVRVRVQATEGSHNTWTWHVRRDMPVHQAAYSHELHTRTYLGGGSNPHPNPVPIPSTLGAPRPASCSAAAATLGSSSAIRRSLSSGT